MELRARAGDGGECATVQAREDVGLNYVGVHGEDCSGSAAASFVGDGGRFISASHSVVLSLKLVKRFWLLLVIYREGQAAIRSNRE